MKLTCNDIRRQYIDFFLQRGHKFVPSSSLLPADDPTLLFTNAGMNQFKAIFLGQERPGSARVVNSQKCIRAGGKHNDLEDVGHDVYHHTFFEMLGNWSFGDYFKAEAIEWAWELLTKVWGLPKERLHATVFEGSRDEGLAPDAEAADLWRKVTDIDPSHIHMGNRKDNFWEMGETGPCGPCSEIHYDFTPDLSGGPLVNAGDARVVEIWNLVFMQFNRTADGALSPLPARHVDTGMGFERVCRVLQGVDSNYDIDVFRGIFDALSKLTSAGPYTGKLDDTKDIAYRVIADHARCLTFAIADGVIPSNEGRGYVLRRILRRAARYGRQYLGIEGSFIVKLVPTVVELMGETFGELRKRQDAVIQTIAAEEESFGRTLDRGIDLFERQVKRLTDSGKKQLPGEVAFDLYATYGFPTDLTQLMAAERGLSVDMAGYEEAMNRHRETSSAGGDKFKVVAVAGLPSTDDAPKYSHKSVEARVLGWVVGDKFITEGMLPAGSKAAVALDRTCFYAESGGQVGDSGALAWDGGEFVVSDTTSAGQCVLHAGEVVAGRLQAGQVVRCQVAPSRLDTMRNHTATHLLNWALREVLGDGIHQAGSVVGPDRLRFDFTHGQAVREEELQQVETLVNQRILADEPVSVHLLPLATAMKISGVRAVFGEKYPDPVRVIAIGTEDPLKTAGRGCAIEFCGGTHLHRTSVVGLFKIVSEESVAKGVRRITALTGREAVAHVQQSDGILRQLTSELRAGAADLPQRVVAMQKELKELRKRPAAQAGGSEDIFNPQHVIDSSYGNILVGKALSGDPAVMRAECDRQRQKGAAAVFMGGVGEDAKVTLTAMVSDDLVKAGLCKAGDWVKAIAPIVGGGGGGKATLAQAGGRDGAKLEEALSAAAAWVKEKMS
ncbi:MAG: alanine--tRNA ligase [Phycisphaerae bacterium]|jgi:alanyl-tRNA synthetase